MTSFLLFTAASVGYAVGGLFMKMSAGVTRPLPTGAFLALFAVSALLQARGLREAPLSTSYVLVLGLEAVVAVLLGTLYLQEPLTPSRGAAILLIVGGIGWLRVA